MSAFIIIGQKMQLTGMQGHHENKLHSNGPTVQSLYHYDIVISDLTRLKRLSELKSWLEKRILPPAAWVPKFREFCVDFTWISRGY